MSDWRTRIEAALERDRRSLREVSLAANVSHGYLHGILRDDKEPTLDRFVRICGALHISVVYALTGIDMNQETEAVIEALQKDDRLRQAILTLIDRA